MRENAEGRLATRNMAGKLAVLTNDPDLYQAAYAKRHTGTLALKNINSGKQAAFSYCMINEQ
jgi:hypothetical protein